MTKSLTIADKKDYAKLLFLKNDLTQKEIAIKVGVSAKTMSLWVAAGGWDKQRKSLLLAKEENLVWLYEKFDALKRKVDKEADGVIDNSDADKLIKLSNTIKNMENNDVSLSEIFSVAKKTIEFAKSNMPEYVLQLTDVFDALIIENSK